MNLRIQELSKQNLLHDRYSRYGETIMGDYYEFEPEELEEFVHLIVQECTKVLEMQGAVSGSEEYYYGSSLLKEHFGVQK